MRLEALIMLIIFTSCIILYLVGYLIELHFSLKGKRNPVTSSLENLLLKNRLYKCTFKQCDRYFRHYQSKLFYDRSSTYGDCPHCGCVLSYEDERVKNTDKWINLSPDCPKVSTLQYLKIKIANIKLSAIRRDEEAIKRFGEYQKKGESDWIERLNKRNNQKW